MNQANETDHTRTDHAATLIQQQANVTGGKPEGIDFVLKIVLQNPPPQALPKSSVSMFLYTYLGCQQSLEWTSGLDWWTDIFCIKNHFMLFKHDSLACMVA